MPKEFEELPLFPLDTVLFPYAQLQLHVFEERYRRMVKVCVEEDRPFGVVLIRSGSETGEAEPYLVGTAVQITNVRTYDDGRYDIQVTGERRFRIREIDESKPFLTAKAESVVEMEIDESEHAQDLMAQAKETFKTWVKLIMEHDDVRVHVTFPSDPMVLSFTMANFLPLDNLEKQRLLETTDTLERIEGLLPIMERKLLEVVPHHRKLRASDLGNWLTPN